MLLHPSSYWITNQYYSFRCPPLLFAYGTLTLFRAAFQLTSAPVKDGCNAHIYPTLLQGIQFVLSGFRSPLLTGSRLVSLPAATKMFQFTACLPISERTEIDGSTLACSYPSLIAACHVCMKTKPGHPLNGVALTNTVYHCFVSFTQTYIRMKRIIRSEDAYGLGVIYAQPPKGDYVSNTQPPPVLETLKLFLKEFYHF